MSSTNKILYQFYLHLFTPITMSSQPSALKRWRVVIAIALTNAPPSLLSPPLPFPIIDATLTTATPLSLYEYA
ncbi:hypothetical protein Scep_027743 [Stephania cephalantha]|uniref:Uncharacterized protein n=1 Tax=Stephania cephalantha TaxID=152367 RepID=A0AAP0E8N6_9MAGN